MFTTIFPAVFVEAVTLNNHTIDFVSRVCDVDFSTWTYNFTSGSCPSISHWVIAWCGESASIIDASHPNGVEYGTDPTTGVHWIKFNVGLEADESAIFWFTLDKCYEASDVEVAIKPGGNTPHSAVTGPIFSYSITLNVDGSGKEQLTFAEPGISMRIPASPIPSQNGFCTFIQRDGLGVLTCT